MNKAKALKTAKEYLFPRLMECLYDCSDSAHEAQSLEDRFNAYVDDSVSIEDFIRKNLRTDYIEAVKDALAENGESFDDEDGINSLTNPACSLPISYEEIKKDLEKTKI